MEISYSLNKLTLPIFPIENNPPGTHQQPAADELTFSKIRSS